MATCQYCAGIHAWGLDSQGEQYHQAARTLSAGDLSPARAEIKRRSTPERITDQQLQGLRDVGWSDAQVAEAVYIGAFFSFANRFADAFGMRWQAPSNPDERDSVAASSPADPADE